MDPNNLVVTIREQLRKALPHAAQVRFSSSSHLELIGEAAWMKGDMKLEVTVTKGGELISEESSMTLDKLPKSLRAMAKKFAAGAELKLERKTIVLYEVEVRR